MLDLNDFKRTVDNKFWKHITRDTLFPYDGEKNKVKIIEDLVGKVNKGNYVASGVREFIIFNKSRKKLNRIARIVPSFHISDYVFVYYLIKKIERDLSRGIHPNAYGSFRNFKYFRDKEKKNHELLGWDSLPSIASISSFHRMYWMFEWKEFVGKARRLFHNKKYKYFISFDIADFYSSINLLLLERKVRSGVPKSKQVFVDLLFYFLQHSNNKFKKYIPEMKGIPQDEVGDASRVLANYFLQSFDFEINNLAKKMGGEVLRFADDHIIFAPNEKIASDILFYASVQLQKIGLSINSSKVEDFPTRRKFELYWSFDLHELIDKKKWKKAAEKYVQRNREEFKWSVILFRFLTANPSKIKSSDYLSICNQLLDSTLISSLDYKKMINLYSFLPTSERKKILIQLEKLVKIVNFNCFHYNLIKAIERHQDFKSFFNEKKRNFINGRLLELTRFFE